MLYDSGEQNASAIWNQKEQRKQKRTLTRHRPETDCAKVGAVEKLTETEDQAQREEHFRLLASFGWRVTKAAVAIANREIWAMVLRFSADFLLLTHRRSCEVALNLELYRSHSVLKA